MKTDLLFLLSKINDSLKQGLPGERAHVKLAPQHRKHASDYLKHITDYKIGCVVSLITKDQNDEWSLLLMERMSHEKDVHSNQISFPGGKHEESDNSFYETALRELNEEVGIDSEIVKLISPLSELYIPPSNFLVKPFLCFTENELVLTPNDAEVKSVLQIPLSFILSDNITHGKFESARGYSVDAPYYEYQSHKIWGATAMMISEIAELLKD